MQCLQPRTSGVAVAFGLGLIPWCGGWGELKSRVREFFGLCTGRRPNGAWSQPGRSLADPRP